MHRSGPRHLRIPARMVAIAAMIIGHATPAAAQCPPASHDRAALDALVESGFRLDAEAERHALALALADCIDHPDAALRDRAAFGALSHWMRADALDVATRRALLQRLQPMLAPQNADAAGFRQPFAALVLSEVLRTDRLAPWMSDTERAALLDASIAWFVAIRDYRGFTEGEGWRHGVAHGADVFTQFAVHPQIDRVALDRVLDAIETQVAPAQHAYIDGESQRLARPVLFAAQRGLHTPEHWAERIARIAGPGSLEHWSRAYESRAGLARRHNVGAFLAALYIGARESGDARFEVLLPATRDALRALP